MDKTAVGASNIIKELWKQTCTCKPLGFCCTIQSFHKICQGCLTKHKRAWRHTWVSTLSFAKLRYYHCNLFTGLSRWQCTFCYDRQPITRAGALLWNLQHPALCQEGQEGHQHLEDSWDCRWENVTTVLWVFAGQGSQWMIGSRHSTKCTAEATSLSV